MSLRRGVPVLRQSLGQAAPLAWALPGIFASDWQKSCSSRPIASLQLEGGRASGQSSAVFPGLKGAAVGQAGALQDRHTLSAQALPRKFAGARQRLEGNGV